MKKLLILFLVFNFLYITAMEPDHNFRLPKTISVSGLYAINNLPNGHHIIIKNNCVKIVDHNNQEVKIIPLPSKLHRVTVCEHFICFHCENDESINFDHNWKQVEHKNRN